jgi:hypothetical protein
MTRSLGSNETLVQFRCQSVDVPRPFGVGLELQLPRLEVVIGFRLLESGLPVLRNEPSDFESQ